MVDFFRLFRILGSIKTDKPFIFNIDKVPEEYLPLSEEEKDYIRNSNKLQEHFLLYMSEIVGLYNPGLWCNGYKIENKEEFIDALEYELARLKRDKNGIKKYYDKYLINYPVYEDWLNKDLLMCDKENE